MKPLQVLHIERDSEHTCVVEILDHEGEQISHVGHTTLSNLEKAGYKTSFKTEKQRVEECFPHITKDTFKSGLKNNYERLSKKEGEERARKREEASMCYIMKQVEGMSLEDVMEKIGAV